MMVVEFAHLSDPHLTSLADAPAAQLLNKRVLGYLSWRRRRRAEHGAEVLEALCADLSRESPSQVLVTGDLTHIGLPGEFREAATWLARLGRPQRVAVVPGNHDCYIASDWRETFAHWQPWMASDSGQGDFPSLRVRGEVAFIGLSSGCPTPPFMATGTLGPAQLRALPALLEEARAAGRFRVLYLHHSPLPGHEVWRKRLTDAPALLALIRRHGAELVLHGHGHRQHLEPIDTRDGRAAVVAVPSASARGTHGNVAQYNRYRVSDAGQGRWRLAIDTRQFDAARGGFATVGERELLLGREG